MPRMVSRIISRNNCFSTHSDAVKQKMADWLSIFNGRHNAFKHHKLRAAWKRNNRDDYRNKNIQKKIATNNRSTGKKGSETFSFFVSKVFTFEFWYLWERINNYFERISKALLWFQ